MQFDYLHAARAGWILALQRFAIPAHLLAASYALAASAAVVCGAAAIERSRCHEAQRIEMAYRLRYERSARAVQAAHIYSKRVASLLAFDDEVRGIVASGDINAERLADLADHLPRHAWLTSLSLDSEGMVLEGRASDFETLGRVVDALMHARRARNPVLTGAKIVSTSRQTAIDYGIRLENAP